MGSAKARVTEIVAGLGETGAEREASAEELLPLVYEELRRLARARLAGEDRGHTLQPTALVHEAYLKLVDQSRVDWRGRTHFFAVAAMTMRRLLIDHARARGRAKRGGEWRRITLAHPLVAGRADLDLERVLSLDAALEKLAALDSRQARIVEMRFFAGLTVAEVAEVLGVSKRTVEGDWMHARSWLRREMSGGGEAS